MKTAGIASSTAVSPKMRTLSEEVADFKAIGEKSDIMLSEKGINRAKHRLGMLTSGLSQ
jgi:hypothetical protein